MNPSLMFMVSMFVLFLTIVALLAAGIYLIVINQNFAGYCMLGAAVLRALSWNVHYRS